MGGVLSGLLIYTITQEVVSRYILNLFSRGQVGGVLSGLLI